MERRGMGPWRATALGLVVAVAGLAAMPRPSSKAQEPDQPSARAALRQKIADLRGEVELRELEHEAERESLKQKLTCVPITSQRLQELRASVLNATPMEKLDFNLPESKDSFLELAIKPGTPDESLQALSKALHEANETKEPKALIKTMLKWLEGAEVRSRAEIDGELVPLKKDFVRHASELCARKLELEDLEKQYRESR